MPVYCGRLIDSNAYPPCLRGLDCILVYSGCLRQQGLLHLLDSEPGLDSCAAFAACPEEHHVNMLGFKLLGMLARSEARRLVVVTVDGSMHCVQLHYMAEELSRVFGGLDRRHYVIERGRLVRVPSEAVRVSRFLSRVARLLGENTGSKNAGGGQTR